MSRYHYDKFFKTEKSCFENHFKGKFFTVNIFKLTNNLGWKLSNTNSTNNKAKSINDKNEE